MKQITCDSVGLPPELYHAAIEYLFARAEAENGEEWYWDMHEPDFVASPIEWTHIQTVLFANAGDHLLPYSNEQVGKGVNYLMSNCISDVPFAAVDESVPLNEALLMMTAMPNLWHDCIGPRLADLKGPVGSCEGGNLGYACYMWFDVWATFWHVRHIRQWQKAMWDVLHSLLQSPYRVVQIAALHGIGHERDDLRDQQAIDRAMDQFIAQISSDDRNLYDYALAAKAGIVM